MAHHSITEKSDFSPIFGLFSRLLRQALKTQKPPAPEPKRREQRVFCSERKHRQRSTLVRTGGYPSAQSAQSVQTGAQAYVRLQQAAT